MFGTIAAESQRMINETYSAFVQGFMPTLARPEVDVLDGLTTAIIVDQERLGSDPRSTVGTATDTDAMLRILFSRLGEPHIGSPGAYSFNVASVSGSGGITVQRGDKTKTESASFSRTGGMCPRCEGRGSVSDFDLSALYDDGKSINEGAITIPGYSMDGWYGRIYRGCGYFDPDKPIKKFNKRERHDLLYREPTKIKVEGINLTYEGLIPQIQKSFLSKDSRGDAAAHPRVRGARGRLHHLPGLRGDAAERGGPVVEDRRRQHRRRLPRCRSPTSRSGSARLDEPSVAPLLEGLRHTLDSFVEIGLGYLSLDRPSGTLSGGEAQRTKMIRHLGSSLTDVTYVFDEPTIGLHPHDIQRMNGLLLQLRDKGNTVLVVEHKPEAIAIADHIVDLGPGAGAGGGEIVFEGTVEDLRASDTAHRAPPRRPGGAQAVGADVVRGAGGARREHQQPAGRRRRHPARRADRRHRGRRLGQELADRRLGRRSRRRWWPSTRAPSGARGAATPRPTPACSTRSARRSPRPTSVKPALFSANSEGACPDCNGAGVIYTDLGMMAGVATTCEECEGKRFDASVLEYTLGGATSARCSRCRWRGATRSSPKARPASGRAPDPRALRDVGLGYLGIGQPLTTLSGGERQRLKLATHMGDKGGIYVLDEPTTGLHLADVEQLLGLLDRLVDSGKSVIVIEHHQAVMAHADWIIDLGPGAGHDGGRIVFEGTPGGPRRRPLHAHRRAPRGVRRHVIGTDVPRSRR